jgi:hypothetical protein
LLSRDAGEGPIETTTRDTKVGFETTRNVHAKELAGLKEKLLADIEAIIKAQNGLSVADAAA